MGHERVDLAREFGKDRQRRWRAGTLNGHDEVFVEVGQLADGRHYAHQTGKGKAWVFHTEREACDLADRWLTDGRTWRPVPASFDADGRPADGGEWYALGQTWIAGKPPVDA
jgi:hypothetical protein